MRKLGHEGRGEGHYNSTDLFISFFGQLHGYLGMFSVRSVGTYPESMATTST